MPPSRQLRNILIGLVIFLIVLLYASVSLQALHYSKYILRLRDSIQRDNTTQEFYSRTVAALEKKEAANAQAASKLKTVKNWDKGSGDATKDGGSQRIIAGSNSKSEGIKDADSLDLGASPDDSVSDSTSRGTADDEDIVQEADEEERSVAGRRKMKYPTETEDEKKPKKPAKSKEEREIEAEMNAILKRGPIIIFSKTYCPYSAKAKRILLDKYTIVPRPHVVELDTHPQGAGLQNALEKSTGRRTVPNILINGKSVGGGDDIESAEIAGTLIEKIKTMGGKRIVEATQRRTGD